MALDKKLLLFIRAKRGFSVVSSAWDSYSQIEDAKDALIDLKEQLIGAKESIGENIETINDNREPSDFEQFLEQLSKRI